MGGILKRMWRVPNLLVMPTINIPDKICSHCNGTEWYFKPSNPGFLICYNKRKEKYKDDYLKRKDSPDFISKRKTWMHNWRQSNKEHVKEYKNLYDKTEKGKEAKRRRALNSITKMNDHYIKCLIKSNLPVNLSKEDIPKEYYDLQKELLMLKRKLRVTKHGKESKILDIPDKICPHCGGTKWRAEKYPCSTNPNAFRYRCVKQQNEWANISVKRKKLLYA